MNPLSLCQLTLETGSGIGGFISDGLLRTVSAAAASGFTAVVPRIRPAGGLGAASKADTPPLATTEIRRRLADTGLYVASVLSYWITPETRPREFEASIDAAAEIGARGLQIVCDDPDFVRLTANFAETCRLAADRKLKVAVEFMAYTSLSSLAKARELLAQAGQNNAGLCLDALHFYRSGGSRADLATLKHEELALVQLCDAAATPPPKDQLRNEARGGREYPGRGALPLDEFVAALPPNCLIDVEAPCAADAALSVEEKADRVARATKAFLNRHVRAAV